MDYALVAKPHLGLGRMYVDIHLTRIHLQKQYNRRITGRIEQSAVGLLDRMIDRPIRDRPAVEKHLLMASRPASDIRFAHHTPDRHSPVVSENLQQVLLQVGPKDVEHALIGGVTSRRLDRLFPVDVQGKTDLRMAQRKRLDGLSDPGSFGPATA